MKNIYYFIIYISLSITACEPSKLEQALSLAGDNRPELEKVLRHYSQSPADSLKLKAAMFLIENMPGHYTLTGKIINEYREKIYSDTIASYFNKRALDISLSRIDNICQISRKKEDVKHITADFLIHHIDKTFEKVQHLPWIQDLPFDIFLEYILPYRKENERIELWIDSLQIDQEELKQSLLADNMKNSIWNTWQYLTIVGSKDLFPDSTIIRLFGKDIYQECLHSSLRENFKSQVSAIPASVDYIPFYANRNNHHCWNNARSPEAIDPTCKGSIERRAAKIFRRTYSRQQAVHPREGEYIPAFFRDPFYKDVTREYINTTNVNIPIINQPLKHLQYGYLNVFCNLTWQSIAISPLKGREIHFQNIGRNILYLPVYYSESKFKPLNFPFLVDLQGRVKFLVPDTLQNIHLKLDRKYPTTYILLNYVKKLKNIQVTASNQKNINHADTITKNLQLTKNYATYPIDTCLSYQYWHVTIPQGVTCAEIIFIDSKGRITRGQYEKNKQALFDNDPLTNYNVQYDRTSNITVDFGRLIHLSRIIILPRSDGNGIYPGDEYELFYHDIEGWKSLGKRTATDYFLEYDNLPSGALYWLHNYTQGVEERPFTITKEGKVRFW